MYSTARCSKYLNHVGDSRSLGSRTLKVLMGGDHELQLKGPGYTKAALIVTIGALCLHSLIDHHWAQRELSLIIGYVHLSPILRWCTANVFVAAMQIEDKNAWR